MENIEKIEFEPVEDLRDLVWRPANLTLKNKGKLIVFIPTRYPISDQTDDQALLARTCHWQQPIDNFYIGDGQRIFISDQQEFALLDISTIQFDQD
jgi:type VI secretion system protein ImpE